MQKVFISHQRSDKKEAEMIAEYFKSCGIEIYFDQFDSDLQLAVVFDRPKDVVAAIKKGVEASTDMLVLVSPNTLKSEWVPFEIGYGYDSLNVMALTLKGIRDSEIPDYIKVVPIIRNINDIIKFVKSNGDRITMERKGIILENQNHPLSGIMDRYSY